jgi:hypothetical protein
LASPFAKRRRRNWMRVGRVKRELGKFGEAADAYRAWTIGFRRP